MSPQRTRWIVGCMTGTSLDGLDAALAKIHGTGLNIEVTYLSMLSKPLAPSLRADLRRLASGRPIKPIEYLRAACKLGESYADLISELRQAASEVTPDIQVDFVVAHGQTIWHAPGENLSWQLLNPAVLARRVGIPVLYDLRQADLAAGGQGAPITPLSDWVLYRCPDRDRLIINLGGILNVTELPTGASPDQIGGRDVGPCNLLIDGVVHALYPELRYDVDGRLAAQGHPDDRVYDLVHAHAFYRCSDNRTTGREDFSGSWIDAVVREASQHMSPQNVVVSAVDAVARDVASCVNINRGAAELVLAGGGAMNPVLIDRIRGYCPEGCTVLLSNELGIPATAREALCLAVLGAISQDGMPITLPQITEAHRPGTAGAWVYP